MGLSSCCRSYLACGNGLLCLFQQGNRGLRQEIIFCELKKTALKIVSDLFETNLF